MKRLSEPLTILLLTMLSLAAIFMVIAKKEPIHIHEKAVKHYPNLMKKNISVCGDTAYVYNGKHFEIDDSNKKWITKE